MTDNLPAPAGAGDILFYQTEDGRTRIQVRVDNGTIWISLSTMAELFQSSVPNISMHLKKIYSEGELQHTATVKSYLTVQTEGSRQVQRSIEFYHLDVVIAVGYRVRSHRGTQFRRWATGVLSEYVTKGFAMDDERLKNPGGFGNDYFNELLDRIRDIRASEKRFYLKICDIYSTSVDYDSVAQATRQFFATVQNKLHYAVHGQTAAEIIHARADAEAPHMGLTSWHNSPEGKIRKDDVTVAKNYLAEDELASLNRVVTMYLDYAEEMARRRRPMYMRDWIDRLNAFLTFNEHDVLADTGGISHEEAVQKALAEFARYDEHRRVIEDAQAETDFDRMLEEVKQLPKP